MEKFPSRIWESIGKCTNAIAFEPGTFVKSWPRTYFPTDQKHEDERAKIVLGFIRRKLGIEADIPFDESGINVAEWFQQFVNVNVDRQSKEELPYDYKNVVRLMRRQIFGCPPDRFLEAVADCTIWDMNGFYSNSPIKADIGELENELREFECCLGC